MSRKRKSEGEARVHLGNGSVLCRQVDGPTLDLSVQEVSVGTEHDGGSGKDPSECRGGLAAAGRRLGRSTAGNRSASRLEPGQDVLDVVARRSVLVVRIHVGLALGGVLVRLLAQLFELIVLFTIVVFFDSRASDAVTGHHRRRRVREVGTVAGREDGGIALGQTALVGENTHVDRLAILGGAISTNIVGAAVSVVSVVVVGLELCESEKEFKMGLMGERLKHTHKAQAVHHGNSAFSRNVPPHSR